MKKQILVLATLFLFAACKKEKPNPTPTSTNTATQSPMIGVEFFVDATKYQVREPIDYPTGSPMFADASNAFTPLTNGNVCSVTGKKINIKYSLNDTTRITLWFYKNGSPVDVMKGTCDIKVSPSGNIAMTYANAPGSSITPYMASCKKAIIFQ